MSVQREIIFVPTKNEWVTGLYVGAESKLVKRRCE